MKCCGLNVEKAYRPHRKVKKSWDRSDHSPSGTNAGAMPPASTRLSATCTKVVVFPVPGSETKFIVSTVQTLLAILAELIDRSSSSVLTDRFSANVCNGQFLDSRKVARSRLAASIS